MREVHQLIMIIPVVLNLKGNLEMNLSARLGTAANVGELDDPAVRRSMIFGNLSLLQVQAAVVSSVAACIALTLGLALPRIVSGPPQVVSMNTTSAANTTARALSQIINTGIIEPRRPIPLTPGDGYGEFTFSQYVCPDNFSKPSANYSITLALS